MTSSPRPRKTRTWAALAALALTAPAGLVLLSPPAVAGRPAAVSLNPQPPDFYSCTTNGAGTHCSGETSDPYGPEPVGIFCGSGDGAFEVLDQAVHNTQADRWYDRDGNLVKRKRVNSFADAVFSSPAGAQVPYSQRDIDTDVFAVPGDLTSGTTYTTSSLRATVPGLGAVLVEKGRLVWGPDGNLEKEAGRHDLLDYFLGDPTAVAGLCSALGASTGL